MYIYICTYLSHIYAYIFICIHIFAYVYVCIVYKTPTHMCRAARPPSSIYIQWVVYTNRERERCMYTHTHT